MLTTFHSVLGSEIDPLLDLMAQAKDEIICCDDPSCDRPGFLEVLPQALCDLTAQAFQRMGWQKLGHGIEALPLAMGESRMLKDGGRALIMRFQPDATLQGFKPCGHEFMLVLEGALVEGDVPLTRGEFTYHRPNIDHAIKSHPALGLVVLMAITN